MKICIKSDTQNLNLAIPTSMLYGKAAVFLVNKLGRKFAADAMKDIPPQALEAVCVELRRMKARHGSWVLVDMESAKGEIIKVIL